jgi:hypothetical protein
MLFKNPCQFSVLMFAASMILPNFSDSERTKALSYVEVMVRGTIP